MRKLIVLFCLILGSALISTAQSTWIDSLQTKYDQHYGLDMLLYNGAKYVEEVRAIDSHPFWQSQDEMKGTVWSKGKSYPKQRLKYHLQKQSFILFYKDYNGQPHQISLNSDLLDSVRIDQTLWIKNSYPQIEQQFIQSIFQGELKCYVSSKKFLNFKSEGQNIGHYYTEEIKHNYLIRKGKLYPFNRKKTFLKIFPKSERKAIRKFMAANQLSKIKALDNHELKTLIAYCERID